MTKHLEADLVINIINMQNKIQKKIGAALSAHGLGLSEYLVLNQLYAAPNQRMRRVDLAAVVGLSPSGVTRLLNPMEKIGLVEKSPVLRDARVSLVSLSEAGRQIAEDAKVSFDNSSVELFKNLNNDQIIMLSDLLRAC
jgi:DNA-binding MarR family transcriptional regulator